MAGEVALFDDDDGVLVVGEPEDVHRFLDGVGLMERAQEFDLTRFAASLKVGANLAETISAVVEQSAMYVKLTPESTRELKAVGGLMKTDKPGVSHVMLGQVGKSSLKWLQAQDGPSSLLTNPAFISGMGGLLSQAALKTEIQELRSFLVRIEEKLDEARRERRNGALAKLSTAKEALSSARTILDTGGDANAARDKVSGLDNDIREVADTALLALEDLAKKVEGRTGVRGIKRELDDVRGEVTLQLSSVAYCLELLDEFDLLELDHVLAVNPGAIDGHVRALAVNRERYFTKVLDQTKNLMGRLDSAAATANQYTVLHPRVPRFVADALNDTAVVVADFHLPLGIEDDRAAAEALRWREALRDPDQLRTAAKEAAVTGGAAALVLGLGAGGAKVVEKLTETDDPAQS